MLLTPLYICLHGLDFLDEDYTDSIETYKNITGGKEHKKRKKSKTAKRIKKSNKSICKFIRFYLPEKNIFSKKQFEHKAL